MNIKNSIQEARIWLGWKRKGMYKIFGYSFIIFGALLTAFLSLQIKNKISNEMSEGFAFFNLSVVNIYCFAMIAIMLYDIVILLVIHLVSIKKQPRNWRLVIEDAMQFLKEFGDHKEKIGFQMYTTRTNKNASSLYSLLSLFRELNKLYKEKEALSKTLKDAPHNLDVVDHRIKFLQKEIGIEIND